MRGEGGRDLTASCDVGCGNKIQSTMQGSFEHRPKSALKSEQSERKAQEYEELTARLKEVLSVLNTEKLAMECKLANERALFAAQLSSRQQQISSIQHQNAQLRAQIQCLQIQSQQSFSKLQHLRRKNSKLQLQRDSMSNIIHYLQKKGRELSDQIYQLKRAHNQKQRFQKSSKDLSNTFLPSSNHLNRESFCEYTDFVEKDFLPLEICRTEACQNAESGLKDSEESERVTVQRKEGKKMTQLERVRSMGLINQTQRETTIKQIKSGKKRDSMRKPCLNLLKQPRDYLKQQRKAFPKKHQL